MPLTGTVDAANARIDLFVDWTTESGTQTTCTLYRRSGSTSAPNEYVRGLFGATLLGEQAYVSDHEAPLDTQIWYLAIADNASTALVAGPFTIPSDGRVWLKDPGRPWADLQLDLCETPSRSEAVCTTEPLVSDSFSRTLAASWGSLDTGQTWTTAGGVAANFAVSGGTGRQTQTTVGATRIATIPSPAADMELRVDVGADVVALTSSLFAGPLFRSPDNANMYGAMLEFTTTGDVRLSLRERVAGTENIPVNVATLLKYTPGQMFSLRVRVQGTRITARVWPAGTAEPEIWQVTYNDNTLTTAARAGLRSFTAAGNTNAAPSMLFDNFQLFALATSSIDIAWIGFNDEVREADAGLFPVLDDERPSDVFARRKDITTGINFLSRSLGAIDGIYELFTAGGPVLVQVPTEYGMEAPYGQRDRYYQPGDLKSSRLSLDQRKPYRLWTAPATAVDAPIGEPQGTDTANWCALDSTYATYADMAASGNTWGQAATGAASSTSDLPGLYGSGPYGSGPYGG